ncbi:hypothetical protein [Lelliottia amnigena]|uniref:hypothetical protein n=1 Tax=Lelliottia amnigena TaxID=61646 RepID=UPI001C22AA01|nr:hypothetical protein [Lelliottia amnigena]QXB23300.1 hypothetical protein I6L76_08335 [Lelliottia amnigena]
MKSKFDLNLPYGVYTSILTLLIFSISIWFKADYSDDKIVIISLFVLFASATIQAVNLIRMDKFDIYKNTLNAIWNIETAITFIYGIYFILEFSYLPADKQPSFTKWAFQNIELFALTITILVTVCVARAGYSVAEIFKDSIKRTANAKKITDENKKPQIKPKTPQPQRKNRRRNRR